MKKLNKNVLVTGGCGFVGANLIPLLERRGFHVTVLDNMSSGDQKNLEQSHAKVIIGDIRNKDDVSAALLGNSIVIHLAAYGSVVDSVMNPDENFNVNVKGTFNVLNEARKVGISNVILASTGGALIGDADPPVNELSLPRPISPYGSSKLCSEAYGSSFAMSYGMNITALRFANVIGPNSWHKKGAVTAFMKAIVNNQPIKIYGDGSATRDFLYVGDLCRGIVLVLEKNLSGFNVMHLSSGHEVSIKDLAELIFNCAGVKKHPIDFLDKRAGEVEKNFADYALARCLIGFEPKINLEQALQETWEWFFSYSALR